VAVPGAPPEGALLPLEFLLAARFAVFVVVASMLCTGSVEEVAAPATLLFGSILEADFIEGLLFEFSIASGVLTPVFSVPIGTEDEVVVIVNQSTSVAHDRFCDKWHYPIELPKKSIGNELYK
jgi:hypothetical protein